MGDIRVGSVLGFEIRIDFSWFILFFLILWTFTMVVFPAMQPGMGVGIYAAMGASATLLFFASLLAHELSHSVVARRRGVEVEGITLFIFGGMARTRMEAEEAGDEFVIAGVGPLSSLIIGALFGLVWWGGTRLGWSPAITGVAQYLAYLNVLLAVFNLLPGFPLDGGRLFRSIAWKLTGDLTRATRMASTGGRWLGYLIIALGVWSLFIGNFVGGIWLVLIGWFLRNAALASYHQHVLRGMLDRVRASDAMTRNPETVHPDITIQQLMDDYFMRRRYAAYPVIEDGDHPVGMVTLQQVKAVPREEWPTRVVADVMTPSGEDLVVAVDERLSTVLEKLGATPTRRLLVSENGHLAGIITASDLSAWLDRARQLEE
ncbi:MAG TPA: site-2 protease family protein [Longimicrobiales bacterium]|nr:site-2 protease family protein [Longimicrobiales bacterium]